MRGGKNSHQMLGHNVFHTPTMARGSPLVQHDAAHNRINS